MERDNDMQKYENKISKNENFIWILNIIHNNLDKDKKIIKEKIKKQMLVSENTLNKMFREYTGTDVTLDKYIEDRKREYNNKLPLKSGKIDISDISQIVESTKFEAIKDYYKIIDISSFEDLSKNKKLCLKLLEKIFKERPYIYYNLGDDFKYNLDEIIELQNKVFGLKSNLCRLDNYKLELTKKPVVINKIRYYMNDSSIIEKIFKCIDPQEHGNLAKAKSESKNILEGYSFRSIFYDVQHYIRLLNDIREGKVENLEEAINSYRCALDTNIDIWDHYDESIKEILKTDEKTTFLYDEAIDVIDIINSLEKEGKEVTIDDLRIGFSHKGKTNSKVEYGLLDLLSKGYIYMYK